MVGLLSGSPSHNSTVGEKFEQLLSELEPDHSDIQHLSSGSEEYENIILDPYILSVLESQQTSDDVKRGIEAIIKGLDIVRRGLDFIQEAPDPLETRNQVLQVLLNPNATLFMNQNSNSK